MVNNIGMRVRDIREALDLSQEQFGKKIGITRAAISNIEKNLRNMSEQTMLSICREYNASFIWLRDGMGDMFINIPETALDELTLEYELNDFERKLVEKFVKLNKQEREAISKYMKSIFDLK